ncbi:hypothetical protein [Thermofilum sp.]|jgi:hypothetical protein|uniref:hypothetical protein n=1 Tax=Thermofilum sp. TaxID=1961369 RepID=UPI00258CD813|nr:hypothetical protein [Thermofilum sp.]
MGIITVGLLSALAFFFMLGASQRASNDKAISDFFAMVFVPGVIFATIGLFAFFLFLSNVLRPPVYNLNLNVKSVDYTAGSAHVSTPDTVVDIDIKGKQITGATGTMTPVPQASSSLSSYEVGLRDLVPLSFVLLIPISYMGGYYLTDILMGGTAILSLFKRPSTKTRMNASTRRSRPSVMSKSLGKVRLEITPDMKLRLVPDP